MSGMASWVRELKDRSEPARHFEERRQAWVEDVSALMSQLERWLEIGQEQGVFTVVRSSVTLKEIDYGEYEVPSLQVTVTDEFRVDVIPKGLSVIGVVPPGGGRVSGIHGRVDLQCGERRAILVRSGPGAWQVVPDGDWKRLQFGRALDEDLFVTLLRELTH